MECFLFNISNFRSNSKYEVFLTHLCEQIFILKCINWKKTAANNHFNNSILSWRHKCLRQSLSKNIIYHTKNVTAVLLKTGITISFVCVSLFIVTWNIWLITNMANLRQGIKMRKQYLYCDNLESCFVHNWTRVLNPALVYEFV